MPGIGTVVNVLAIVAGGVLGLLFGRLLTEDFQNAVCTACGVSSMFLGIGGTMSKMLALESGLLTQQGSMMMIGSIVGGCVIGEILKLEDLLENFGEWLKKKSGSSGDAGFVHAFVTASLTVCIGAMAVVGSIEDGINLNPSILYAKSVLDFVIVAAMSASMGRGCAFSAVSVGLFQGAMTVLGRIIAPVFTPAALANLSYVGNIMIFCVGVNLVFGKKVRVANLLPGLVIAVVWSMF